MIIKLRKSRYEHGNIKIYDIKQNKIYLQGGRSTNVKLYTRNQFPLKIYPDGLWVMDRDNIVFFKFDKNTGKTTFEKHMFYKEDLPDEFKIKAAYMKLKAIDI